MNVMTVIKRKAIYRYVLAFIIGGGMNYGIMKLMHLSTNVYIALIPIAFAIGAVWLLGKIRNK